MCGSTVDIQSPTAEIRRGKKKIERKKDSNHRMKIYMVSLLHRATIKKITRDSENTQYNRVRYNCALLCFIDNFVGQN